ncbi:hypothetical protein ACQV5M_15215 [Leptospira sp. SA-E8]|uniref:hypothetical protein n=1 Tax=Leptospira sp. SA-E8 TaxID=3422259 RepID=UPI003EC097E3
MFCITEIKDIITSITAVAAIIIAIFGLSTWRRQLKGNRKYDLSFECLQKLKILIEAINGFRHSYIGNSEMVEAYSKKHTDSLDFMDSKQRELAFQYAMELRWDVIRNANREYQSSIQKLEIILNETKIDTHNERRILDLIIEILDAWQTNQFLTKKKTPIPEAQREKWLKDLEESEDILNSIPGDRINQEIDALYNSLNAKLRKHLK